MGSRLSAPAENVGFPPRHMLSRDAANGGSPPSTSIPPQLRKMTGQRERSSGSSVQPTFGASYALADFCG
jgi:hypothetical protein